MVDYGGNTLAQCCMGVYENRLGGRVCVAGYYPWTYLQSQAKSAQLKSVMRWLSKDTLPGWVESFHKTNLWARKPADGALAVAILNASLDPAEDIVLMLRSDAETVSVFDMRCEQTIVHADGTDRAYRKYVLPRVEPWTMMLAVAREARRT